jgi:hypothetical protein
LSIPLSSNRRPDDIFNAVELTLLLMLDDEADADNAVGDDDGDDDDGKALRFLPRLSA